ncbi:MAG: HDIG domain-containing protein [Candidatus Sumerlaeia bacterium]
MLERMRQYFHSTPEQGGLTRRAAWLVKWAILGGVYILVVLLVSSSFYAPPLDYQIGKVLVHPIVADFSFRVHDRALEREKRAQIRKQHERVYAYNPQAYAQTIARLDQCLDLACRLAGRTELSREEQARALRAELQQRVHVDLPETACRELLHAASSDRFRQNVVTVIDFLLNKRGLVLDKSRYTSFKLLNKVVWKDGLEPPFSTSPGDLIGFPEEFNRALAIHLQQYVRSGAGAPPGGLPSQHEEDRAAGDAQITLMQHLIDQVIVHNIALDEEATEQIFRERLKREGEFVKVYRKGDEIAPQGVTVDSNLFFILEEYTAALHRINWLRLGGNALYVLIVYVLIVYFVRKYRGSFTFSSRNVILFNLPIVVALAVGRLGLMAVPRVDYAGYLFPAALIGMTGVIVVGPRLATQLVLWGGVLFGAAVGFDFRHVAVALFGGMTAVASLYQFRERRDVFRAGLQVGAVNFISVFIINYIQQPARPDEYLVQALIGLGNGVACAAVTPFAVGVFEWVFGIVTDMRLLELSGIRHRVLREMEEQIPGTWQHSLNVAKLAEDAANAIGANYLLVRTGAYYHDIGKLENSKYFSENQDSIEDKKRHSKLTPNMSVLIIKNHVKKGIERALDEGLPQQIIDFIPQHHGTSLIKYFYNEAMKKYETGELSIAPQEDDFRYDGPKPQTIEAAILMLADSVEATATAELAKPTVTEDEITKVVHDTIVDKFNDGQFDECDMTLRDLHQISQSFTKTLVSRFHKRVVYPKLVDKKDAAARDSGRDREKKKRMDKGGEERSVNGDSPRDDAASRRQPSSAGTTAAGKASGPADVKVFKG